MRTTKTHSPSRPPKPNTTPRTTPSHTRLQNKIPNRHTTHLLPNKQHQAPNQHFQPSHPLLDYHRTEPPPPQQQPHHQPTSRPPHSRTRFPHLQLHTLLRQHRPLPPPQRSCHHRNPNLRIQRPLRCTSAGAAAATEPGAMGTCQGTESLPGKEEKDVRNFGDLWWYESGNV